MAQDFLMIAILIVLPWTLGFGRLGIVLTRRKGLASYIGFIVGFVGGPLGCAVLLAWPNRYLVQGTPIAFISPSPSISLDTGVRDMPPSWRDS